MVVLIVLLAAVYLALLLPGVGAPPAAERPAAERYDPNEAARRAGSLG